LNQLTSAPKIKHISENQNHDHHETQTKSSCGINQSWLDTH